MNEIQEDERKNIITRGRDKKGCNKNVITGQRKNMKRGIKRTDE